MASVKKVRQLDPATTLIFAKATDHYISRLVKAEYKRPKYQQICIGIRILCNND